MTKRQRCLCHCPYFILGPFVSKENEFNVQQRHSQIYTANLVAGPGLVSQCPRTTHHALVPDVWVTGIPSQLCPQSEDSDLETQVTLPVDACFSLCASRDFPFSGPHLARKPRALL